MRVVAVTGQPGTGKTQLIDALVPFLTGWQYLSIDEERARGGDWTTLAAAVAELDTRAIVESVTIPRPYAEALELHDTRYLVTICDEETRARRLEHRTPTGGLSHSGGHYRPDAYVIDTSGGIPHLRLERIATWARGSS